MRPQSVSRPRHLEHLADDARGYPVIATIGRGKSGPDFGSLNELRKLALATFDWCSVCGLPFGDDERWQVAPGDDWKERADKVGFVFNEAPAHEICLIYAAHVCPHLSSPGHRMGDEYRAGQHREDEIHLLGFRRTAGIYAIQSELQRDIHILAFEHADPADEVSYARPEDLAGRYSSLLADEQVPALSDAESGLVRLFNDRTGDNTVPGAAIMAGAAFLPKVFQVQGADIFAESPAYKGAAVSLLSPRELSEFGAFTGDPASKFMCAWLLERQDTLPDALAAWRREGARIAAAHGRTPPRPKPRGPGRTVPRSAPCPCGSGRKAGRCHPAGLPDPAQ